MSTNNGVDIEVAANAEEAASEAVVLARGSAAEIDAPITGGEMAVLFRLARGLAASGMFKDARQAEQAFAKLIFGRDLGLSATQAMTDIHIIEGKPEMSANLQAAKVRGSKRYEYDVDELTETSCKLSFFEIVVPHPQSFATEKSLIGASEFTIEDATRAGLAGKGVWQKYPKNMLFARAMSNGVAWYCPDVMNGIRVYAEGELADVQRVEGTAAPVAEAPAERQDAAQEPQEAEIVADPLLTNEARAELVAAVDAAGVSIDILLAALGLDSTDDLTESGALKVREKLGEHLASTGASA